MARRAAQLQKVRALSIGKYPKVRKIAVKKNKAVRAAAARLAAWSYFSAKKKMNRQV